MTPAKFKALRLKAGVYGHRKEDQLKEFLARENGTIVAARLATRYLSDILAKGVEEMITVDQKEIIRREYFLNPQIDAGDCQGGAPWPHNGPQGHL